MVPEISIHIKADLITTLNSLNPSLSEFIIGVNINGVKFQDIIIKL